MGYIYDLTEYFFWVGGLLSIGWWGIVIGAVNIKTD